MHLVNQCVTMATVATKGYDCELFISQVPSQYKCPICKCVIRDVHRVTCCDEEFCKICIMQVLGDNKPCPGCGNDGDISTSENKKTKSIIGQLRCRCSNQREGCEWEGELQELDNHLNENPTNENRLDGCKFTKIHCQRCQEVLPRNKIGDHLENVCQNRQFDCQYCGHNDTYERVMTNHLPECPQQPVECPQRCGMSPERQNLAAHEADECPNTTLMCEVPGCEERRQRKDIQAHNQEYSARHVELLSQEVRVLSQKVRELEVEAQQWKEEQSAQHLPIILTMKNYEQLLTGGDQWMSRLLYTQERGYAIFLSVYVAGYGPATLTGDISVYVNVARGEYDGELQWPYQFSIEVSLLSQEENGENVTKIFNIRARKAAQNSYGGCTSFTKERIARRYAKNNCLKFKVSNVTEHNND